MKKANKTVNVTESTKKLLEAMKKHPRDTYDDVISDMLNILEFHKKTEPN